MMAVKELMDYLDNGNIKNSVNFPNCDMGVCTTVGRLALLHKNVPNMIADSIPSILHRLTMNIANMTNKSVINTLIRWLIWRPRQTRRRLRS